MATTESQLASLLAAAASLRAQLAAVEAELAQLGLSQSASSRAALEATRDQLRRELSDINAEIANIQANLFGRTSSGQIIAGETAAKSQNAVEVAPTDSPYSLFSNGRIRLPPDTSSGSNAEKFLPNVNVGVDNELRPFVQTQSTPLGPVNTGLGLTFRVPNTATVNEDRIAGGNFQGNYGFAPQPGGQAGVGAREDTGTVSGGSTTVTALNAIDYTSVITAQPNVLTQYASYTYQASLYLCTKQQYQRMINTGQKTVSGAQLLMQSGGSSIADGVRNPNFDLDFYIDSIELRSFFAGKAVRLAHNVKEVKMTVIEPNGITLLNRLKLAVDEFAPALSSVATTNTTNAVKPPGSKSKNFTAQIYLLAIRFYGYDEKGNLVRAGTNQAGQTSDPNAFVEKWYPLILTKFNFKVASKLTEYDLEFKAPPYIIAASAQRATIPFNVELSGGTVSDILAGPTVYGEGQTAVSVGSPAAPTQASVRTIDNAIAAGTASAPAKANAATSVKQTVRQGIMQALNDYQRKLVAEGTYQFADEYNIEFALDAMASATVTNPGGKSVNKTATSMAVPTTAADAKLGAKQSMDPNSRVQGATAGTQVVQFIDTLMRNSSYIRDQQRIVIDENTGKEQATGVVTKNVSWYKIGFRAEAMLDKYDEKRQDYAYKITYVISPFKLVSMDSPYFTQPKFNGVHKSYKYWFTGENTEVLGYEEKMNSLYYVVMSGSDLGGVSSSIDSDQKFSYQTASGQASQGAEAKTLEPAANAADQLYNPADLKSCTVTIVGDPAWLQQGEAFVGLKKGQPDYFQAYLADGTINFDSQQILFEIAYNTAGDYDAYTGLIEVTKPAVKPDSLNTDANTLKPQEKTTQISRVYIAKQCISEFKKGKFTQTLEGTLKLFKPDKPVPVRKEESTSAANQGAKTSSPKPAPQAPAPKYAAPTSVTGQTPTSATARGVQQLLRPPSQLDEPTLSQLQASPAYIQARRSGATPQAALDAARSAFAAGTNNFAGVALPGIRDTAGTLQKVVKDGNPG